jgi:hypothetical protein
VHEKWLEMVRNIYDDILKTDDHRERMGIEKYGMLSESVRRWESFVKVAQWVGRLNIKSDDLDPDPWLFNVKNGTVNVMTGEFTEHKQENMITKIANEEYDPQAECPLWKQFVREIMDYKTDLITFVQTAAGWSLTGDISEQTDHVYPVRERGKREINVPEYRHVSVRRLRYCYAHRIVYEEEQRSEHQRHSPPAGNPVCNDYGS